MAPENRSEEHRDVHVTCPQGIMKGVALLIHCLTWQVTPQAHGPQAGYRVLQVKSVL